MKTRGFCSLIIVSFCICSLAEVCFAIDKSEFIAALEHANRRIPCVELHIDFYRQNYDPPEDKRHFCEADCRFTRTCRYIKFHWFGTPDQPEMDPEFFSLEAYDGFYYYKHDRNSLYGNIGRLNDFSFRHCVNPMELTGSQLDCTGLIPISEYLKTHQQATVLPEVEEVGGHKCYVLDIPALIEEKEYPGLFFDMKIWLDVERDFRVLKLETYMRFDNGPRALGTRIDNVKLRNINGFYVPVSGRKTVYEILHEIPEGRDDLKSSKVESKEMYIEYMSQLIPSSTPRSADSFVVTVDSVKVHNSFRIDDFQLIFPQYTEVIDEIHGKNIPVTDTYNPVNPIEKIYEVVTGYLAGLFRK